MLEGLARFSYRHKVLMLFIWIVVLVGIGGLNQAFGAKLNNNFNLPGTETQRAFDILEEKMPGRSGDTGQIVFRAENGIAAVRERMEAGFEAAEEASGEDLAALISPYSQEGARQVAPAGPSAGKIAYAELQFNKNFAELPLELSDEIIEAVDEAVDPDSQLTVEYGGPPFQELAPPLGKNELYGLGFAVLILLVSFGSLLAMGLPILTALFGVGIGVTGLTLLANVMDVVTFAPLVASMIGLGVGIDYALFIVTRYRNGLKEGLSVEDAVVKAMTTAGRAVVFAAITVIISLLGMFIMELSFVYGLAVGAGIAVLVTMLASITLLPALMAMVGRRIDSLSIHFKRKGKPAKPKESAFWYRWSRGIQRHPIISAILCLAVLGVLAAPTLSIRLGNQDAGNGPTELTTRRAYDLLSDAFGPGSNGPLLVAASFDDSQAALPRLTALATQLAADPGVASVSPVIPNETANPQDADAAIIQVIGKYAPQDERTDELVHHLRDDIISKADGDGLEIHAGGPAAIGVDLTDKLTERLPYFFGGVILLSFLLLMMAFRSILVPLKAALMNLIAIAAAFGVLVAIFQWGWWPAELIGVDRTGPIAAFTPMLLFAILFGLSMDYEVFLLSRIKEEHDSGKPNDQAVADGLASTARVITAAAAIMVTVFFSFVLGEDPNAKLVGLGLAAAVLIDATLVRMILVPATMELLGEANWYLPRWLDKILPKFSIEGEEDVPGLATQQIVDEESELVAAAPERQYRTVEPRPEQPMPRHHAYPAPPPPPAAAPARDGRPLRKAPRYGPTALDRVLRDLPFKAGVGDVRSNLEEVARATYNHFRSGEIGPSVDVSRVSGYLALEQRLGRIGSITNPEHAAQLLIGAVAAKALTANGDQSGGDDYARAAVKIVLEGIGKRD
ncbi:MAG TPA: MMPL family transporter [Actinomycetota bacterium]|nr:MMPL family transporter [Actinomycetota bacterium]